MPRRPTHVVLSFTTQDGYTLERVDVYGLVDGVHETVVIPGAECYVGRSDNPSFSSCGLLFSIPFSWASTKAFHILLPPKKRSRLQVGSEPLGVLTNTIWHAVGPSGRNKVQ